MLNTIGIFNGSLMTFITAYVTTEVFARTPLVGNRGGFLPVAFITLPALE
jgi:hypothetical protein